MEILFSNLLVKEKQKYFILKITIVLTLAICSFNDVQAQLRRDVDAKGRPSSGYILEGVSINKEKKVLSIKSGFTFKRTGTNIGQVVENSTSRITGQITCNCSAEARSGICDISVVSVGGETTVTCGGNCDGGCASRVTIDLPPKSGGKKPTKNTPVNWQVVQFD